MFYQWQDRRPKNISFKRNLIIDRKADKWDYTEPSALVCIGLEGILFKTVEASLGTSLPQSSELEIIEMEHDVEGELQKNLLLLRPGAAEFIVHLVNYVGAMIYSTQKLAFVERAILAIANAQVEEENEDDGLDYGKADSFKGVVTLGQEQCMHESGNYYKSLGALPDYYDYHINDIWLIDHQSDFVDFPCRVIEIPKFTGDPEDRELYKLAERIFIN